MMMPSTQNIITDANLAITNKENNTTTTAAAITIITINMMATTIAIAMGITDGITMNTEAATTPAALMIMVDTERTITINTEKTGIKTQIDGRVNTEFRLALSHTRCLKRA